MNVTWEQIVDYARGLADEPTRRAVEADPDALERARALGEVSEAKPLSPPELWMARAKALLPAHPTARTWFGRLILAPAAGFRAGATAARDLRYEFDGPSVELRVEPVPQSNRVSIVGLVEELGSNAEVLIDGRVVARCDELGQFHLETTQSTRRLVFRNPTLPDLYEVELP